MLQSIEHQAGLPLAFDPMAATLHWPEVVGVERVSHRTFRELSAYLAEPDAKPSRDPIYTVYRDVARREDAPRVEAAHLRYDITMIPAGVFAGQEKEYFRTAGHYHARLPGRPLAYPEVYEVIHGRAYWLIQRLAADDPAELAEIYVIEAGPGEKAIMLPGFGHISINAFAEPLIMANWICLDVSYDYGPYEKLRGGGYWLTEGDIASTVAFKQNGSYRSVPALVKLRPAEVPAFALRRSTPLYALSHELDRLSFLSNPEAFPDLLTLDRCFQKVV